MRIQFIALAIALSLQSALTYAASSFQKVSGYYMIVEDMSENKWILQQDDFFLIESTEEVAHLTFFRNWKAQYGIPMEEHTMRGDEGQYSNSSFNEVDGVASWFSSDWARGRQSVRFKHLHDDIYELNYFDHVQKSFIVQKKKLVFQPI